MGCSGLHGPALGHPGALPVCPGLLVEAPEPAGPPDGNREGDAPAGARLPSDAWDISEAWTLLQSQGRGPRVARTCTLLLV